MRLEGRVLKVLSGWEHAPFECYCLVYQFRRFLPEDHRRRQTKPEIVQLWGHLVRRQWNNDAGEYPPVFDDYQAPGYMHTLDVKNVVGVLNFGDEGHPFTEDDLTQMEGWEPKLPPIPSYYCGDTHMEDED